MLDGQRAYPPDRDPMQHHDVAADNPEMVVKLRRLYDALWKSDSPRLTPVAIDLKTLSKTTRNPAFKIGISQPTTSPKIRLKFTGGDAYFTEAEFLGPGEKRALLITGNTEAHPGPSGFSENADA